MPFIADASVSLCWLLPDQFTAAAMALLARAQDESIVVPVHWHLEVINKLGIYRRKGKLSEFELQDALEQLNRLEIDTRLLPTEPAGLLALMQRYTLTSYDAAYLQLAISTGLPLATYDAELIAAAPLAGVPLLT